MEPFMNLSYCGGEDGAAYYAKGHVDKTQFLDALKKEVDSNDPILIEPIEHTWKRMTRDFQEQHTVIIDAKPNSRGAFPCTWIEYVN